MRPRTALAVGFLGVVSAWGVVRAQRPFKEYPALEYENFAIPSDSNTNTEWVRARLRYPDIYGYPQRQLRLRDGRDFPGYWTMDYPRSDRHLLAAVRRLTRIDTRLAEQVAEFDGTDDVYNWPVLYGVEVGHWLLPDNQAAQFRDYLMRGGFFMCDDFHGDEEWSTFMSSMAKVLPGRSVEDIPGQRSDLPHPVRSRRAVSSARRAVFPDWNHLRKGRQRQGCALALHSRRQGPNRGCDLPQHGFGRRLGVRR